MGSCAAKPEETAPALATYFYVLEKFTNEKAALAGKGDNDLVEMEQKRSKAHAELAKLADAAFTVCTQFAPVPYTAPYHTPYTSAIHWRHTIRHTPAPYTGARTVCTHKGLQEFDKTGMGQMGACLCSENDMKTLISAFSLVYSVVCFRLSLTDTGVRTSGVHNSALLLGLVRTVVNPLVLTTALVVWISDGRCS